MIELPEVGGAESLVDYIRRLIDTKIITPQQIPAAIKKYNSK